MNKDDKEEEKSKTSTEGEGENTDVDNKKFGELIDDAEGEDQDREKLEGVGLEKADLEYLKSNKGWSEVLLKHEFKETMMARLIDLGYKEPSKIQSRAIPYLLANTRVGLQAQAQNGTGKTLAFLIPSIMRVNPQLKLYKQEGAKAFSPQVLILSPNAELASQVQLDLERLAEPFKDIRCPKTSATDSEAGHILVRTPGKIFNLIDRKLIDLTYCRFVVIDEADEMLKQEIHRKPIDKIVKALPKNEAGIAFFSATFVEDSSSFIQKYFETLDVQYKLNIDIPKSQLKIKGIKQFKRLCKGNDKIDYLKHLLTMKADCSVIIFVNTKKFAEVLANQLRNEDLKVGLLVGGQNVTKQQRAETLEKFRRGIYKILITTNLLARGFDERTIGLVINFDIPREYNYSGETKQTSPDYETFLHRVGRTGRFGDVGLAVHLYLSDEQKFIEDIAKYYDVEIIPLEGDEQKTFDQIEDCLQQVKKLNDEKRKELGEKKRQIPAQKQ